MDTGNDIFTEGNKIQWGPTSDWESSQWLGKWTAFSSSIKFTEKLWLMGGEDPGIFFISSGNRGSDTLQVWGDRALHPEVGLGLLGYLGVGGTRVF